MSGRWPAMPYADWAETCAALHLRSQIAGKYRLSHTPWVNHSWHATLYVTARGLTTRPVPDPAGHVTLSFDLCDHRVVVDTEGGARETFPLEAMSVAEFLGRVRRAIGAVGGTPDIHGRPNEIPGAAPFARDAVRRPYDADAVQRFHRALLRVERVERVFSHFRTSFLGKVSPLHLFWGSFDLAVTRFSGRRAPLHPGGIPGLPDAVTHEAYSHEVSPAGFWPGGNGVEEAMFYSYAYPVPEGFEARAVEPDQARWNSKLGEFLLPYDALRTSDEPEEMLMRFLQSIYAAAADAGRWDRDVFECGLGHPGAPRPVTPP